MVVANDSGSVTSSVAGLTLVSTNQYPIAPNYTNYVYENQTINFDLSALFHNAIFPDGDPGTLSTYDTLTTNGVSLNYLTSTLLSYTPNGNYIGADLWTYTITDAIGDSATGTNYIEVIQQTLPTAITSHLVGGTLQMSGSGGSPGGTYNILGSSNLESPLSTWPVVATGSFNSSGGFSISLPTGGAAGYYALELP